MQRDSTIEGSDEEQSTDTEATLVGLKAIRSRLQHNGLDVNDDGFIVDATTGEMLEPYSFSLQAFQNHENPSAVDDPLAEFSKPESECPLLALDHDRVHLSDLHTTYTIDGKSRPIRDDMMSLTQQVKSLGMTYDFVCEWSNGVDFVRDMADQIVTININLGDAVHLNCFNCDSSGGVESWSEEYGEQGIEYRCPECTARWDLHNIQTCTSCQNTFLWEEIAENGDEDISPMRWEPTCPECNAGVDSLHSEDRYRGHNPNISEADEPVIEEPENSLKDRHFKEAEAIDNQLR